MEPLLSYAKVLLMEYSSKESLLEVLMVVLTEPLLVQRKDLLMVHMRELVSLLELQSVLLLDCLLD